jgi:hypothetical protein
VEPQLKTILEEVAPSLSVAGLLEIEKWLHYTIRARLSREERQQLTRSVTENQKDR